MTHSAFPPRLYRTGGALVVACGVIMGALTAHLPETAFATGGRVMARGAMEMQMWQGLALVALGLGADRLSTRLLRIGAAGILLGTLLFCGAVYYTAFTGHHAGHVAPTGGSLLILSWLCLAFAWARGA
ncbi:DUF423 domain-containing protein [Acetobacter suratthaniensis]|uniref:DUF423 domain-containing protein n=1 Tax=Acetobacter suratthaniensis TaxID=1502841 RepID=A0ABS3LK40_9PROT|nr:DUF423 domain-containing protein [Acetobacter suratthaniensis]MBO1327028.1 DUF423 domain-containing protein [Acetobacter suratthaniensis]MCX2565362.1 DUF423 domain-containing protein [Acetobacter suratthaniensis]